MDCDWRADLFIFKTCERGQLIGPQGSPPGGAITSPYGGPQADQSIAPIGVVTMQSINKDIDKYRKQGWK
jgi:hypothetical protein